MPVFPPKLPDAERTLLSKTAQQALLYGCPLKYLYLTEDTYQDPTKFRDLHKFKHVFLRRPGGNPPVEISVARQCENMSNLVNDMLTKREMLIGINSYPFFKPSFLLFWHLVCLFSVRKNKDSPKTSSDIYCSLVGNMRVDSLPYDVRSRHTIGYGPCTQDNFLQHDLKNVMSFISRFDNQNKIILMCASDATDFAQSFHCNSEDFDYFFELDCGVEKVTNVEAKKQRAFMEPLPKLGKRKKKAI